MNGTTSIVAISLLLLFQTTAIDAGELSDEYGSGNNAILNFYQKVLSPAKGGNQCPMHPSCSQYAKMAVRKNPVTGSVKSFDRLIRCGQDRQTYALHDKSGKLYDPPDQSEKQLFKNGRISSETEAVLGLHLPETYHESMSLTDFFLLTRRYGDALSQAFGSVIDTADSSLDPEQLVYAGKLQLASGDYAGFRRLYDAFSGKKTLSPEKQTELDILLAKSFYLQNNFKRSLSTLSLIDTGDINRLLKDEIQFTASLDYIQQGDITKLKSASGSISSDSPRRSFAKKCTGFENYLPDNRFRSPTIAGVLSVFLPGAGYFYSGRKSTAFAALIINALFIGSTVEAFRNDNYFIGSAAAMLGSGWYFGNIYGSYASAVQHNKTLRSDFITHFLTRP